MSNPRAPKPTTGGDAGGTADYVGVEVQFGAKTKSPPPIQWEEYDTRPKQLSRLYPAGTPMSEVHPDFRGMSLERWQMLKIAEQCEQYHNRMSEAERAKLPLPHNEKIHTARDGYGKW